MEARWRISKVQAGLIILGDIIVSVNNKPVATYDDMRNEFDKYKIGDVVNLGITRNDKKQFVSVKLEEVR